MKYLRLTAKKRRCMCSVQYLHTPPVEDMVAQLTDVHVYMYIITASSWMTKLSTAEAITYMYIYVCTWLCCACSVGNWHKGAHSQLRLVECQLVWVGLHPQCR